MIYKNRRKTLNHIVGARRLAKAAQDNKPISIQPFRPRPNAISQGLKLTNILQILRNLGREI
jgi:hypothetical protein